MKMVFIVSLGLIILEILAEVTLPQNGEYWSMIRNNEFGELGFGNATPLLVQLVKRLLRKNPRERLSAKEILEHEYVRNMQGLDGDGDYRMD